MESKPDEALHATKRFLSQSLLAVSGWKQESHDAAITGPMVWCYVFDLPTKWVWMCTVDLAAFTQMSAYSHTHPEQAQDVYNGVAEVLGKAAQGKPPLPMDNLNWEQQLGALLALYAGTTQVWERAGRFAAGGHFVVLNYRKPGGQDSSLRPFALGAGLSLAIPAAQLQEAIAQVIAADRTRHPEWFG